MTDADDKLSRRYREAAREEPPAHLDAAILAASRRAVGAGPRTRKSSWMVPASIAAVLVLGIGVSLRMQLEKPGIESAPPGASAEYPMPSSADPVPAPEPARRDAAPPDKERTAVATGPAAPARPEAKSEVRSEVAKPLVKRAAPKAEPPRPAEEARRKEAAEPNPFADQPIAMQPPVPASPPAVAMSAPTMAAPPPPAAAGSPAMQAAAPMPQVTPVPQAAPAMRAKVEGYAADSAAARESRALTLAADPDPVRELERIARLRESGRHEEADRALADFRRRHPDYRIPEAVWERVKPR